MTSKSDWQKLDLTIDPDSDERLFFTDHEWDTIEAEELSTTAEVEEVLVSGRALMVMVIERGFSAALARGESARVQLLIDGSDNSSAVQARARLSSFRRFDHCFAAGRFLGFHGG